MVRPIWPKKAEYVMDMGEEGYHSNDVLKEFEELEVRTYCTEPDRGHRIWRGQDGPENQPRRLYEPATNPR
jgi:hypothetical protein